MEQRQLIDLLNDMSLEEKAGQLFQVTGDWFDGMEALEQTGPEAEETARIRKSYSHLAGSVLGVYGAANIKRIQSAYMEPTLSPSPRSSKMRLLSMDISMVLVVFLAISITSLPPEYASK